MDGEGETMEERDHCPDIMWFQRLRDTELAEKTRKTVMKLLAEAEADLQTA